MGKDIFGLSEHGFEKRVRVEKKHADSLADVFTTIIEEIRNTAEADGWQRIVIFNDSNKLIENFSYPLKLNLLYYLRRHPNIISKLSDKEKKSYNMKPYVYKWVSEEEKIELGIDANYFRHINTELLNYINKTADTSVASFVDILSVAEFLLLNNKKHDWYETTTFNISVRTGVPVENVRAVMHELYRTKLIVSAYTKGDQVKGRFRQFIRFTSTLEEYAAAVEGKGITAEKIVCDKDLVPEKFDFTVLKYFYSLIGKSAPVKKEDYKPVFQVFQKAEPAENNLFSENEVEEKPAEENSKPIANAVAVDFPPQLTETLDDIKKYVTSFAGIAESIFKNEEKKIEALNGIIQMNNQQREENEDLKNQLNALRKILNREERDKHYFIKSVQDSLNMMMGQIISATDSFTRVPRHMLNERTIQTHKADVIKIAVQTANDIQKLFSEKNER